MKDWKEEAEYTLTFHEENVAKHGRGKVGRPRRGIPKEGWSIEDTANALDMSKGRAVQDIALAKSIRAGDLKNIKSRPVALDLLFRAKEKE